MGIHFNFWCEATDNCHTDPLLSQMPESTLTPDPSSDSLTMRGREARSSSALTVHIMMRYDHPDEKSMISKKVMPPMARGDDQMRGGQPPLLDISS